MAVDSEAPSVIVTACSWALLHATAEAFNHLSLIDQINAQWSEMNGHKANISVLRLCCSHYLNALARRLAKINLPTKASAV